MDLSVSNKGDITSLQNRGGGTPSKNRNGYIDCYRLLASIIIMVFHSYHLYNISWYPFQTGFIFVEAFFLLTGYFTCLSIEKHTVTNKNGFRQVFIDSIGYTVRKYSKFIPYTAICVFISLIIRHVIILKDFTWLMIPRAIFESLTVIRGDSNVGVIWYLTALLPVIPWFYMAYSVLNKKIFAIGTLICYVCYYLVIGQYPVFFPYHYFRAMAGLCCGGLCFCLSKALSRLNIEKWKNVTFWIGSFFLIIPVVLCFFNVGFFYIDVGMFIVGFALLLSNSQPNILGKLTNYMGKISFPIYLVSLNIADFINWYCININEISPAMQYVLYFIVSLILSVVLEVIVDIMKKYCIKIWRGCDE